MSNSDFNPFISRKGFTFVEVSFSWYTEVRLLVISSIVLKFRIIQMCLALPNVYVRMLVRFVMLFDRVFYINIFTSTYGEFGKSMLIISATSKLNDCVPAVTFSYIFLFASRTRVRMFYFGPILPVPVTDIIVGDRSPCGNSRLSLKRSSQLQSNPG